MPWFIYLFSKQNKAWKEMACSWWHQSYYPCTSYAKYFVQENSSVWWITGYNLQKTGRWQPLHLNFIILIQYNSKSSHHAQKCIHLGKNFNFSLSLWKEFWIIFSPSEMRITHCKVSLITHFNSCGMMPLEMCHFDRSFFLKKCWLNS